MKVVNLRGFALPALLELAEDEILPITTLVAKTSHRLADLFAIPDQGYLREGYWADLDLVLIKPEPDGFFGLQTTGPISMQLDTLRWTVFP
jgi:dihydroorotase-like cyclic amidohydrolase